MGCGSVNEYNSSVTGTRTDREPARKEGVVERKRKPVQGDSRHFGRRRKDGASMWIGERNKPVTHLLLPAFARIAGLGSALALVVRDSWARHDGEGDDGSVASRRPAIG